MSSSHPLPPNRRRKKKISSNEMGRINNEDIKIKAALHRTIFSPSIYVGCQDDDSRKVAMAILFPFSRLFPLPILLRFCPPRSCQDQTWLWLILIPSLFHFCSAFALFVVFLLVTSKACRLQFSVSPLPTFCEVIRYWWAHFASFFPFSLLRTPSPSLT